MSARYWIAQHIEDLFRNEPKNVGVLVELDGERSARFFGELEEGQLDGRKLRVFKYPDVYTQWVNYWRAESAKSTASELVRTSGSHYRIVEGGVVDDAEQDEAEEVVSYLYSLLVSEGGFKEALEPSVLEEQARSGLVKEVRNTFWELGIYRPTAELLVRHPIEHKRAIRGAAAEYKPEFVQQNSALYVMETVDFTTPKKRVARDHAGWAAYMFQDLKKTRDARPISIVKIDGDGALVEDSLVRNGLSLLQNESEVVPWNDLSRRQAFLVERRRIAFEH